MFALIALPITIMTTEATSIPQPEADAVRPAPTRPPAVLIESERSPFALDWREMWVYRELLYILVWRDIKVRYKQTVMGALWVVMQPLLTMLVFTFIFSKLKTAPSGDVPYPLFAYSGLLLWTFFANAITNSVNSLISNSHLVTKVYFPRLFIPAATVVAGLLDLAVASVILVGLLFYYRVAPTINLLFAPAFLALMLVLALAAGLIVSAVTVKFRDLRHVVPFAVQILMLASPVIYSSEIVGERWQVVFALNPLAGIIEGFRASLFGGGFDTIMTVASIGLTLTFLLVALYVFRRIEETFEDFV